MSSYNTRRNTGQQITTDYELGKIFLWNNRYENDSWTNNSNYASLTILAGTVMGRIANSGIVVPSYSGALDGSQDPIGILAQDVVALGSGQSKQVSLCVAGDVDANKLIFLYGDTLESIVAGKRFRDRIQGNSVGIKLIFGSMEMTDFDV